MRRRDTSGALVTGVQTCALPISSAMTSSRPTSSPMVRAALGILDGVGDAVDQRLAGQAAVAPGKTGAVVAVPEGDVLLVGQRLQQAADLAEQLGEVAALLPHPQRAGLAAGDRKRVV